MKEILNNYKRLWKEFGENNSKMIFFIPLFILAAIVQTVTGK